MKRKLTLALAVIMAAGALTGCGGSTPSENSTNSVADESAPAGTTAPIESQTESQTEPAADTSVTEPAQETVSEPEIQPLPDVVKFGGNYESYATSGYDTIDPDALFHETISDESDKLELPEFGSKWTQEARDLASKYDSINSIKYSFLPDSADDYSVFQTFNLLIKPDHSAIIANIDIKYSKDPDLSYSTRVYYKDLTTDQASQFTARINDIKPGQEFAGHDYNTVCEDISAFMITELPLFVSHNVDVNSGVYVDMTNADLSDTLSNIMRYNISTADYPDMSRAYFYDLGVKKNPKDNKFERIHCNGIVAILYKDGTLSISQMLYGNYVEDTRSFYNYNTQPVDSFEELRNTDSEFDTAYAAWLDGKMPFMIPLDEYLEKYAADSANG